MSTRTSTPRARGGERCDELRADSVAVEDVGSHGDRAARPAYRLEHRGEGVHAVDQRLDRVAGQERPADHLADQPRERQEVRARLARWKLRLGTVAHHAATQAGRAALHPVDADRYVEKRPERRQHPDHGEPERRSPRVALVEHGVARGEDGGNDHRPGESHVDRVAHRRREHA